MEIQTDSMDGIVVEENGSGQEGGDTDSITGNALRMSLRERPRKEGITRSKRYDRSHFMDDFDPENSEREKRKTKRSTGGQKYAPYDEYGHLRFNGADVCDCMNSDCPGCWYECDKCGSTKCGATCRINRKFCYESMAFDGKDMTILNPNMPQK